tara:strand:- start:39 stop:467 length:429 start_codon:yes stop_codon:yes gene_type:complete
MEKKLFEHIKGLIKKFEGYEIEQSKSNGQNNFIAFKYNAQDTTLLVYLFYEFSDGEGFFRIFTTFHTAYDNPKSDFHLIISKLNLKSIWGGLVVMKDDNNYFYVSYKSNIVINVDEITSNNSFNLFLTASISMINMHHKELN